MRQEMRLFQIWVEELISFPPNNEFFGFFRSFSTFIVESKDCIFDTAEDIRTLLFLIIAALYMLYVIFYVLHYLTLIL